MFLKRIIAVFCSLRLTVICMGFAIALVFFGTLAQVTDGLYVAQDVWFHSFVVLNARVGWLPIPIFPGGYLIGGTLLVNLIFVHLRRFRLSWGQSGIILMHFGIIIMLVGQLVTDMLSTESAMRLRVDETLNYSEDFHSSELVVVKAEDSKSDMVVAIPETRLARGGDLVHPSLPFTLRVAQYWPNCEVRNGTPGGGGLPAVTRGECRDLVVEPHPPVRLMDARNVPAAVVEVIGPQGSLGTWLLPAAVRGRQSFDLDGATYSMAMRFTRHYKPFGITLLTATHKNYQGTDIPKDFRSRVRVQREDTGEARETEISMNQPLRFAGYTFFQYQMSADEATLRKGERASSTFQVVKNPSWFTPYVSCIMVSVGLIVHFLKHLTGFLSRRRPA